MRCINIILVLILLSIQQVFPQTDSTEFVVSALSTVERGRIENDKSRVLKGYGLLERALAADPGNISIEYHLAYTGYRLLGFLYERDNGEFTAVCNRTEKQLDEILRKTPDHAEAQALFSMVLGYKLSKDRSQVIVLGPRANMLAENAVRNAPRNPRALFMYGIQRLNTPEMYGGSVNDAIEAFQKSVEFFENEAASDNRDPLKPSWGYTDALTWLGIAYERAGRNDDAVSAFQKVLEIEPENGWVKYSLLPTLTEKMNQ